MKKIISIGLVIVMLLSLAACSLEDIPTYTNFIKTLNKESIDSDVIGDDSIKIGVIEPLTGQYASSAGDELKGVELANKLFPQVLGKNVELIIADNQSNPDDSVVAVQQLIDAGCRVIIGSYGNLLTLAIVDVIEEAQVPLIIPSCTNPLLTTTNDYSFRVCIVEAFQGNSAAKYIIEYLPTLMSDTALADESESEDNEESQDESSEELRTVKCLVFKKSNDDRATALIERFQAKMESVYGDNGYAKVVEYPGEVEDFTTFFERLKNAGAEAVFFPSTAAEGEKVLYEAYKSGYSFQWVGDSDWADLVQAANDANRENLKHLEGVAFVQGYDSDAASDTPVAVNYYSAARRFYNVEEPGNGMALGFDAYLIALEGLKNAGVDADNETIRYEINRIRELDCVTGSITYRAGIGDPVKDVVIEKYVNGEARVDYVATPSFGQ